MKVRAAHHGLLAGRKAAGHPPRHGKVRYYLAILYRHHRIHTTPYYYSTITTATTTTRITYQCLSIHSSSLMETPDISDYQEAISPMRYFQLTLATPENDMVTRGTSRSASKRTNDSYNTRTYVLCTVCASTRGFRSRNRQLPLK